MYSYETSTNLAALCVHLCFHLSWFGSEDSPSSADLFIIYVFLSETITSFTAFLSETLETTPSFTASLSETTPLRPLFYVKVIPLDARKALLGF